MKSLAKEIKERGIEIGFVKIGIARADVLKGEADHLRAWLNRGYHGTMGWMENQVNKRIDVRQVLQNARSVIVGALNYFVDKKQTDHPSVGKISRYAWGDDYHDVLGEKLEALCSIIRAYEPGCSVKYYVDTGPVMEKVWASRAGIGWQGKHTNLITRDFGSWVFLGVILTDLELESDEPVEDLCGTCSACIDACPTQAIVESYQLDASKCISYLTIEHRGEIQKELQVNLDRWVFGCDVCQDVCPWNRFQRETEFAEFQPRMWNLDPALDELLEMNEEEFTHRYRRSPIKRTKLKGLKRNVRAILDGLPA